MKKANNPELLQKMKIKYIGRHYGRITILDLYISHIKPQTDYNVYKVHCLCDCGNKVDVYLSALQTGNTQSCGCYRDTRIREKRNINLAGEHFRNWIVIRDVGAKGTYKHTQREWLCRCVECGKEKTFRAGDISREIRCGNHIRECKH